MIFMKKIILIISFTFLISCKAILYEDKVIGKYILKTPYSEITIKNNGEFYYKSFQGLTKPTSEGFWELKDGNKLFLNSKEKYRSGYAEIIDSTISTDTSIVKIFDGDNNLNMNGIIYINDNPKEEFKLKNGKIDLSSKLSSISVLTLDGFYTIKLDSENYYNISIRAKHEEVNHKFFKNELFTLKPFLLIDKLGSKYKKDKRDSADF